MKGSGGRKFSEQEMQALSAFAAGELPEEEARVVEERVRREPALADRVDDLRRARRALADFGAEGDRGEDGRAELRGRVLAATLPTLRDRYAREGAGSGEREAESGVEAALPAALVESLSALAAGELPEAEARRARELVRREPAAARAYGDFCRARRALSDFAAGAETAFGGGRPELRERILAATGPAFRRRYVRRTAYWPVWLAAAAAVLVVAVVRPAPVAAVLDRLFGETGRVGRLAEAAAAGRGPAAAELGALRAEFGAALDDRMDRWGDRLRDFEQATRGRTPAAAEEAGGGASSGEVRPDWTNQGGDTAP